MAMRYPFQHPIHRSGKRSRFAPKWMSDPSCQLGQHPEALDAQSRCVSMRLELGASRSDDYRVARQELGLRLVDAGRYEEGLVEAGRVLEARQIEYGPEHSWEAPSWERLATIHGMAGQMEEELAALPSGLAARDLYDGRCNERVRALRVTLAERLQAAGRLDKARAEATTALGEPDALGRDDDEGARERARVVLGEGRPGEASLTEGEGAG